MRILRNPDKEKLIKTQSWNSKQQCYDKKQIDKVWGQIFECELEAVDVSWGNTPCSRFKDDAGKIWDMSIYDTIKMLKQLHTDKFKFKNNKIFGVFKVYNQSGYIKIRPLLEEFEYDKETKQFNLITNWMKLTPTQRRKEEILQDVKS